MSGLLASVNCVAEALLVLSAEALWMWLLLSRLLG
jgi:hypothetical protein